jgi:hypothetical protein
MTVRVILHVLNEESIVADLEELPDPKDNCIIVRNPRKRDGKSLTMLAEGVETVIYPWTRITYIEVLDQVGASSSPSGSGENIVGFFREDNRQS